MSEELSIEEFKRTRLWKELEQIKDPYTVEKINALINYYRKRIEQSNVCMEKAREAIKEVQEIENKRKQEMGLTIKSYHQCIGVLGVIVFAQLLITLLLSAIILIKFIY